MTKSTSAAVRRLPGVGPSRELLTVREFARRVGRNSDTIYRWINRREMPEGSVVMVHGMFRIDWQVYQSQLKVVM
jgi:hypothetical protein